MVNARIAGAIVILGGLGLASALLLPSQRGSDCANPSSLSDEVADQVPLHGPSAGLETPSYDQVLASLDELISAHQTRFDAAPDDWVRSEPLVEAILDRAGLTWHYADYQRAEEVLELAFAEAPAAGGPLSSRIRLNASLHRYGLVRQDLELARSAAYQSPTLRRVIASVEAALLMVEGDGTGAVAALSVLAEESTSATTLGAAAIAHWKVGRFDEADAMLARADEAYFGDSPITPAWIHLHRGLLDFERGRLDDALIHYRQADSVLPGWWLVEEHIAEALMESGEEAQALEIYESVVERTGHPEFMNALAEYYLDQGDDAQSQVWAARAAEEYERVMAIYPEAIRGHAAAHWRTFGDADAAVAMAEANAENAPHGDALTALVLALLRADRLEEAAAAADRAVATGFSTADLHSAAGSAYNAVGRTADAEAQWGAASAIDPRLREF